jgi:[ribosomal protein S18]-alanine N-acetyltransferase
MEELVVMPMADQGGRHKCMIRRATPADLPALHAIQACASQWAQYDLRLAERDSQVAGFVVTRCVAQNEHEILDVAVAFELRRRGFATLLLQHVMRESPGTYFLEVRQSNHAARQLYTRLGFEETGTRPHYYANPDEAAIVMRFRS